MGFYRIKLTSVSLHLVPNDLDGTRNETNLLSGEIMSIQNQMTDRVIQRKLHLNRLQAYLSAGRPGKEFFYKLSGAEEFFNSRKKVDSASTFTVKGIYRIR